jgi:cell fate (sporulation/competence/biofilm development) regulator YlbF (YheA/YmcA/DUF963 family)
MQTTTEETHVTVKTRELCQAILDQPDFQGWRRNIDAFLNDDKARAQYDGLVNKGQALQQKQQNALPLSGEEVADFEQHREELLKNPVAREFLDAQQELHELQESIQHYVSKTLELGRLPTAEEMESSCGHGCGCHH